MQGDYVCFAAFYELTVIIYLKLLPLFWSRTSLSFLMRLLYLVATVTLNLPKIDLPATMDHLQYHDPLALTDIMTNFSASPSRDYSAMNNRPDTQSITVVASYDTPHWAGAMAVPRGTVRQISEKDWDDLKDVLYTHYIQQNMKVGEIIKLMREKRNFMLT